MRPRLSMKLFHDKFRFHITTLEIVNDSITVGGNNYNTSLSVYCKENVSDTKEIAKFLTETLVSLCEKLHHGVVIPENSEVLVISRVGGQINVNPLHESLRYSFPERAVRLCPIKNTTINDLCLYLSDSLHELIKEQPNISSLISKLKLKVNQNIGPKSSANKFKVNN